jgi:hypothetical protein
MPVNRKADSPAGIPTDAHGNTELGSEKGKIELIGFRSTLCIPLNIGDY